MKHALMTAAAGAALLGGITLATTATAKVNADWIENISISKNGIDTRSVKVMPRDDRYSEVQTTEHRFLLAGHVKAKRRKEIARVTWQSKENPFFAQGANKPSWEQRALIRRGLRETSLDGNQTIDLSRVTWVESPEAACESLKASKMSAGMSQADVFGQAWSTYAKAAFFMKADVIRKNDTLNDQNYDTETASMSYPVRVECLAQPARPKSRRGAKTKDGSGGPPVRKPGIPIE